MPDTALKIKYMLGTRQYGWADAGRHDLLYAYDRLGKPELLFAKIEDEAIEAQVKKLEKSKLAKTPPPEAKPIVSFDDFTKMDIRIGTIIHAEKMPKSKKLLKLTVDTGLDKRTVLSGIAEHFTPEEVVGKQVTLLANLAPRPMMGIESQGMILMAEDRDGSLHFVQPTDVVGNGSTVR